MPSGLFPWTFVLYLVTTCVLGVFAALDHDFDYLILSACVGGPFVFGIALAQAARAPLLTVYAVIAFGSAWLAPLGFFFERDKFTQIGGQGTIKGFTFDALQFAEFYQPVLVAHCLILVFSIAFLQIRTRTSASTTVRSEPATHHERETLPGAGRAAVWPFRTALIALIVGLCYLNLWMFQNGIGITGIEPPYLPFKISGISYYVARFVAPALILWLLVKFRPTTIELMLLLVYAAFAAFTSVSRTSLILLSVPVMLVIARDRKVVLGVVALMWIGFIYPYLGFARNFVYAAEDGVNVRNVDFGLIQVIGASFLGKGEDLILAAPLAIVERIGGGQDVILAAQYDRYVVGGPLVEFLRLYIHDFWDLASTAQAEMYDFAYTVRGFAVGDGGFFAHMLLVGGRDVEILLPLSMYLGAVLAIGESVRRRLEAMRVPAEVVVFYSVFFNILFFALSIPLWFNAFLVVTFCAVRLRLVRDILSRVFASEGAGRHAPISQPGNQ